MHSIKQEMTLNSNRNIPDLHAVKIELENIKTEPSQEIETNTISKDNLFRNTYIHATEAMMECFHDILRYYEQHGRLNYATHHLLRPIEDYRQWDQFSLEIMQQLNIPVNFGFLPVHSRMEGSQHNIIKSIRAALKFVQLFYKEVRQRNVQLAGDLNSCVDNCSMFSGFRDKSRINF